MLFFKKFHSCDAPYAAYAASTDIFSFPRILDPRNVRVFSNRAYNSPVFLSSKNKAFISGRLVSSLSYTAHLRSRRAASVLLKRAVPSSSPAAPSESRLPGLVGPLRNEETLASTEYDDWVFFEPKVLRMGKSQQCRTLPTQHRHRHSDKHLVFPRSLLSKLCDVMCPLPEMC